MSVQTLYTAATGMESLQTKLDVIANNLANVNTTGFKRGRTNFQDLFYRQQVLPGALDQNNNPTATGIAIGMGTRLQSVQTDFTQGASQQTNDPLNVSIQGNGFFQVQDPNTGQTFYSRAGDFSVNANGALVIGSASIGRLVQPAITLPQGYTGVVINPNGTVMVSTAGSTNMQTVGQLQITNFNDPEGLLQLGDNMYSVTDASGQAITGNPGQNGLGVLQQNSLEASNVDPVQELIDLITTQRSFELNSQAVKAGDEVLQLISSLKR